jgi:hypothetical protein
MSESVIDQMFKKIHRGKTESLFRYNQRVINEAEKYKHATAMANGYKHQFVKSANRVWHLAFFDGRTDRLTVLSRQKEAGKK